MSLREAKQSNADWGWLRDIDSSDNISVTGIGVVAIHLHKLIIEKSFIFKDRSIDTFRICITMYGLSRYSKSVRVYPEENSAELNQTMQMMIRIYDQRHDKRHLIHVILYGYLNKQKRYIFIEDQIIDSIKLVSVRHIGEAVLFEGSREIFGKGLLLIELIFVYGRHGYNYSSQLIFQNDIHLPDTVKNQTLFDRHDKTDKSEIDLPIFLKLSFDELNQYISENKHHQNLRFLKALAKSSKYSSMSAIMDMNPLRKQRLDILFNFLTEGPYLPEQNIIEPTASYLIPWSITYWKRGLSGIPLHGSDLNMNEFHNIEADIKHLQNTSPILRQIIERQERINDRIKLNKIKELVHHVIILFSNFIHD